MTMRDLVCRLNRLVGDDQFSYHGLRTTATPPPPSRPLIVLSGDISDVDGFYGLAKYAQSGADVLFCMTYPAYVLGPNTGLDLTDEADRGALEKTTLQAPGMGYRYGVQDVIKATRYKFGSAAIHKEAFNDYTSILKKYTTTPDVNMGHHVFWKALTHLAFFLAVKVWDEAAATGRLFFRIGGINTVNPFAALVIKNELFVYATLAKKNGYLEAVDGFLRKHMQIYPGDTFDKDFNEVFDDPIARAASIYVDFSGSASFFTKPTEVALAAHSDKIRAAFIMGGVFSDAPPLTMPSIPGVLNRFSCATMNQLYSPNLTAALFYFLKRHKIPTFTVCNNAVEDLATFADADKTQKTDAGWETFLRANGIGGAFLVELARTYYNAPFGPPRKPFDFYTAKSLVDHLRGSFLPSPNKFLHFNPTYGVTLVGPSATATEAVASYVAQVVAAKKGGEDARNLEIATIKRLPVGDYVTLAVRDLAFPPSRFLLIP